MTCNEEVFETVFVAYPRASLSIWSVHTWQSLVSDDPRFWRHVLSIGGSMSVAWFQLGALRLASVFQRL